MNVYVYIYIMFVFCIIIGISIILIVNIFESVIEIVSLRYVVFICLIRQSENSNFIIQKPKESARSWASNWCKKNEDTALEAKLGQPASEVRQDAEMILYSAPLDKFFTD